MANAIELYDVVALVNDVPNQGLIRGQVGTVVHVHGAEVFEVEFSDNDGHAYALLPLRSEQLLVLHHEPVPA